jgi:HEAT repeat protein
VRPPAVSLTDALGLVFALQAVLIALVLLVVVRKLRRDRRERASLRRRAEFAAALGDGSARDLRRIALLCVRQSAALSDLYYVLKNGETLATRQRDAFLEAARRAGLIRKLRLGLEAPSPAARGVAALTLSTLRLPGLEPRVARLLADADPDVRLAASTALTHWATPAAATSLLESLDRFDLPPERIVEKLGAAWAAPVVHAALAETLGEYPLARVSPERLRNRVQLARALEICGYQEAEPELLQLLATGDLEEQIGAARALGAAGSRRSVPGLIKALESDSWPLRAQAARALGRLVAVEAMPQLAARLSDPAWWVRKQAGRALVALGSAGGYELLQEALAHDDRYARDRAVEELRIAALAGYPGAPELTPVTTGALAGDLLNRGQAA